ncbi:MAG: MOSC domain-containing protein [Pseudomonadales bacterium]|nr:MOSC domain-containing protein [Pseudomonadales bacterium]
MLKTTKLTARIEALFINPCRDEGLVSTAIDSVQASYAGIEGESHGGFTRPSCSRVLGQYPRGTQIRNVRQVTIVSVEELEIIRAQMGIPELKAQWLGANILLSGIADFSLIPPSSRLISANGLSIVADMTNGPCKFVGDVIDKHFPGKGKQFPKAAFNLRGVTGWVEREGVLQLGDELILHVPYQPPYQHSGL